MTSVLGKIFGPRVPSPGDRAYAHAMSSTDELIDYMRKASESNDPARAIMADLWRQRHNIPFMTTVIEAVQEMKSGIMQDPNDFPPR